MGLRPAWEKDLQKTTGHTWDAHPADDMQIHFLADKPSLSNPFLLIFVLVGWFS